MRQAPSGQRAEEDRPRLGRRLEPGGHVGGVTERDRLRIHRSDEPDRGGPAVDADSHGEARDPPGRLDVARVPLHDLEDPECGPRCALRVVLVRRRDAEVRADAVALVCLHHPAVLVDGSTHHRHALPDEHLDLVGLEPFSERRGADDVREENGDRAALVLRRSRGVQGHTGRLRPDGADDGRRREGGDRPERGVLVENRLLE